MVGIVRHMLFRSRRKSIALSLLVLYLVIAFSPLAALAMHSKQVLHAVTGECTGDCGICGCSVESRASGTCCCARQRRLLVNESYGNSRTCCAGQRKQPAISEPGSRCLKTSGHILHGKHNHNSSNSQPSKFETILKCGYPCGKGKILALAGLGSLELLPMRHSAAIVLPHERTDFQDPTSTMISRQGEPPTPPPKLLVNLLA